MKIRKAVITAAGNDQRSLPLQTLIDRDGREKSILRIIIEEAISAGIDEVCVVVQPGDQDAYRSVAGDHAGRLVFAEQREQLGYGHAIQCAQPFVGSDAFLHLVGDHLYVHHGGKACAEHLVELAEAESCAVSAVQATRENLLPYYGTVGAKQVAGRPDLYHVDCVIEKPTPTEAEQRLVVPGMRVGHYLCFFGMHVLTNSIFGILDELLTASSSICDSVNVTLADALAKLCEREQSLAVEQDSARYDIGVKYGLMHAQLALAISGQDREEVLASLLALLAQRELNTHGQQV